MGGSSDSQTCQAMAVMARGLASRGAIQPREEPNLRVDAPFQGWLILTRGVPKLPLRPVVGGHSLDLLCLRPSEFPFGLDGFPHHADAELAAVPSRLDESPRRLDGLGADLQQSHGGLGSRPQLHEATDHLVLKLIPFQARNAESRLLRANSAAIADAPGPIRQDKPRP